MSPRAACRLEQLGYNAVDYAGGKADWAAAGLALDRPSEAVATVGEFCHRDVPTCGVNDPIGRIAEVVSASAFETCLVVTPDRCVVGRLLRAQLREDPGRPAGEVMRLGPSTFRPSVPVPEMLEYMDRHDLLTAPVTTGEGILVGLVLRADLQRRAERVDQEQR
jgi:Mg/Co/Ni transporter MgtE